LPAWARLTGNDLVSHVRTGRESRYLVCKGSFSAGAAERSRSTERLPSEFPQPRASGDAGRAATPTAIEPTVVPPPIPPLAVMGIGSWPRPRWLLNALHSHLEGRLSDEEFHEAANDAVRLAVQAQLAAGVDVLTDGEQRRDNYASFVGGILDNCQLIPITDLLPYVDDPQKFKAELRALDVPAEKVRHPAVFGRLGRSRPLAVPELAFVRMLSELPVKVALPGPYLLTRTMWMECILDRAYETREVLAEDVVRVLRAEVSDLLAAGAALVQLDEPVLTEVVFGQPAGQRSFMCGALGARRPQSEELAFAEELINRVVNGFPAQRLALHICRGNWTPDERAALAGDYRPLLPLLAGVQVGTLFLELCTPRAGEIGVLAQLPSDRRIGVGVVNQKSPRIETTEEILQRAESAIQLFGVERVLLNPDCGFATFADNAVSAPEVARQKLAAIVQAAAILRQRNAP
jgi:5-methyltetrahydropteroyltriglutamate--homocysteine methyltransferase